MEMATQSAEIHSLAAYRDAQAVGVERRPLRVALFACHRELFGAERALLRLAMGFGHWPSFQPIVVVPAEGGLSRRCRALGIRVLIGGQAPLGGTRSGTGSTARRIARNLHAWPRLVRRLARFDPDAIYTSTAHVAMGAAAARQLGVAHLWHVQEIRAARQPAGAGPAWPVIRRLMGGETNRVVGNSEAVSNSFAALLPGQDVSTVYEGFDFPPLQDEAAAGRYRARVIEPPTIELATAGFLFEGKGQDDAIRAVADLVQRGHRVHLNIAGDGDPDYIRDLHELARQHHIEQAVTFHGFVSEPGTFFERSAITLICGRCEGFGRGAVESLSHGTPVIAADNGGLPEIVRPGRTGLLYPTGDWRALSDRIQALLRDEALYGEIAAAGAVWTRQHFPARRYVREMGDLITRDALATQPDLEHEISAGPTPMQTSLAGQPT